MYGVCYELLGSISASCEGPKNYNCRKCLMELGAPLPAHGRGIALFRGSGEDFPSPSSLWYWLMLNCEMCSFLCYDFWVIASTVNYCKGLFVLDKQGGSSVPLVPGLRASWALDQGRGARKARGAVTAHGLDVAPLWWPDRIFPRPKKFRRCVIL